MLTTFLRGLVGLAGAAALEPWLLGARVWAADGGSVLSPEAPPGEGPEGAEVGAAGALWNEELVTVGADRMAVSWVTDAPGETALWLGERPEEMRRYAWGDRTRHHLAEVEGLAPDTRYVYRVETDGTFGPLNSFRTLPKPPGTRRLRLGWIADSHLAAGSGAGDLNQRYLGKLTDAAPTLLERALNDLMQKGVDAVVHAGDLTDTAHPDEYHAFQAIVAPYAARVPYAAVPGNHDKYRRKTGGIGEAGFREAIGDTLPRLLDLGAATVILLDSARPDDDWGWIPTASLTWLNRTLNETAGRPTFIVLHHPANGMDLWFGTTNFFALQAVIAKHPHVVGVLSGHMHRNFISLARHGDRTLPYIELPATVQFPNGYGLIDLYDGGYVYTSHKISAIDLSERSREAVLKGLNDAYVLYTLGGPGDRNLSYDAGRRTVIRQSGFAVVAVVELTRLFTLLKERSGAAFSVAAADAANLRRLVFGRFATREEAERRRAELAAVLPFPLAVREEAAGALPRSF
ncbi:metallophosphoesterase family protein [Hydrogenibacillus sp. N12]|uniref:purple acid phosphatase family protein n=1 Tax=Hydrogenibacillus sp. N12 TaxID=2866627 RepID=UPI001C7DDC7B|nr:metallophosphoesterase family protein [Hydrogenibacillus sp. N12]QZA33562.1 metallophosphoesterase family protein [Hydrogenibacillus sp. N12]